MFILLRNLYIAKLLRDRRADAAGQGGESRVVTYVCTEAFSRSG